jgi:hypothetical protein
VTKAFTRYFDGVEAQIRDVQVIITKSIIAEATELARDGEN